MASVSCRVYRSLLSLNSAVRDLLEPGDGGSSGVAGIQRCPRHGSRTAPDRIGSARCGDGPSDRTDENAGLRQAHMEGGTDSI